EVTPPTNFMRVAGRLREARLLPRVRSGRGEDLPLLLDEPDVVLQVPGGVQDQLPQRHRPALSVDASSLPRLRGDEVQAAGRLAASERDQDQFFFKVAVVVADGFGVGLWVSRHQQRAVEGQRSLEAVCKELLAVADVADDLQGAPPACNGTGEKF